MLGESALDERKQRFLLDVGADYLGPANYDEDFTVAGEKLRRDLVASPFLNYEAALRSRPQAGAEVLATLHEPYFNRTYGQFCSHQNTPNRLETAPHPAALRKGRVVFLPHRLGKLYYEHGARVHRDLFANALALIYSRPMVQTSLPSAGRVSLMHQPQHRRYVAHLLYGAPLQRGRCLVIEDLPALVRRAAHRARAAGRHQPSISFPAARPCRCKSLMARSASPSRRCRAIRRWCSSIEIVMSSD